MASGVPVVASSHESMDEAAGDAALRADPESPEEFAAAIATGARRPGPLTQRGLAHALRFTWLETGRILLEGYREAAA